MADMNLDAQKAREEIFKNVDGKRSRKQVIRLSVEGLLDKAELKDKSPASRYNNVCSVLGGVLDALIRDGYIRQDAENATLFLCEIEDAREAEPTALKAEQGAPDFKGNAESGKGAKHGGKQNAQKKKAQAAAKQDENEKPSATSSKKEQVPVKADVKPAASKAKPAKADKPSGAKEKGAQAQTPTKGKDVPTENGKSAGPDEGKSSAKRTSEKAVKAKALKLANEDAEIERKILDAVKKEKHTRREILTIVESDDTEGKDEAKRLRTRAGQLLSNLKDAGKILFDKKSGAYSLPPKKNEELIHGLSGEEFNIHTQRMLYEWYKKFGILKDLKSENTDSSGDNGVDCYIKGTDGMGFKEYIIIQSKHRAAGNNINIKDVREFIGIVAYHLFGEQKSGRAERPTKFIYSTNAKLTKEAQKYMATLPFGHMLLILDGDEWLKKAHECGYNI